MSDKSAVAAPGELKLNTRRAARYLRREKKTLHNLVSAKLLEAERTDTGRLLFRRSVLDEFLEARGEAPGPLEE